MPPQRVNLTDSGGRFRWWRTHLESIGAIAAGAFAHRPWCETPADTARLIGRMCADSWHPGFVLTVAQASQCMIGFAYGVPSSRLAALVEHPPTSGPAPFEFRELAVLPAARGHGAGAALHDVLTAATLPGPRWLTTHPGAAPAIALYHSRGWRTLRLVHDSSDGAPMTRVVMHRSW